MSRDFEHFVFRKEAPDPISAMHDVKNLKVFFVAIPTGIINIDNDSIMILFWLFVFVFPAIIIVIVVVYMYTTYKVAHFIAWV